MEERDPLSAAVIGAAIEVHKLLGPGLLEVLYHRALRHELASRGIPFRSEQPVPVNYKGHDLGDDLRLDLVVAEELIVELKAVEHLHPDPRGPNHHLFENSPAIAKDCSSTSTCDFSSTG